MTDDKKLEIIKEERKNIKALDELAGKIGVVIACIMASVIVASKVIGLI